MPHDANKIQMGTTRSSIREVSNHVGAIAAGKVVRLKSDDTITTVVTDGAAVGVSIGRDQSSTTQTHTAIVDRGLGVPILLDAAYEPEIGEQVAIIDGTGIARAYTGTGDYYVNAHFSSEKMSAVDEDGAAITNGAAYIDFPGGL